MGADMRKLKKLDPVIILWQDTHIPLTPEWMTEAEHKDWIANSGSKVLSIGFFISEDKDFIHLVGDTEADKWETVSYLRPISIGKGFIQSITILKRR